MVIVKYHSFSISWSLLYALFYRKYHLNSFYAVLSNALCGLDILFFSYDEEIYLNLYVRFVVLI